MISFAVVCYFTISKKRVFPPRKYILSHGYIKFFPIREREKRNQRGNKRAYTFLGPRVRVGRVMKIKIRINKWDLIKFKRFWTAKETINKRKRQPSEWEKIFTNETIYQGLILKMHKHLMQTQ